MHDTRSLLFGRSDKAASDSERRIFSFALHLPTTNDHFTKTLPTY